MEPSRFRDRLPKLRVQMILYNNRVADMEVSIASLARAVELVLGAGLLSSVDLAIGDCSPQPALTPEVVEALRARHGGVLRKIDYQFFSANLGSAAGHNRLLEETDYNLFLIQNPDTIAAPNLLIELVRRIDDPTIGIVEARQVPLEHPKDYDRKTGDTGWASTACALFADDVLVRVGGFDAETFFLYCDDVDFSWRVRLAGYRVVYQPTASVFHDKRLTRTGAWPTSPAEEYYSAEAAMFLAHKYSRPDILTNIRTWFGAHGNEAHRKALAEFEKREREGRLPTPIDAHHVVAEFVANAYTRHRF